MTQINEEAAVQNFLVTYLSADGTLMAMVNGIALRTTWGTLKFPAVKIDRQDGSDLMGVGTHRIWADMTFLVRGIVRWQGQGFPDWSTVRAIGDRLDVLLHSFESSDATVRVHSFREEPFTDETVESGDLYLHAGGIYRIRAQAV